MPEPMGECLDELERRVAFMRHAANEDDALGVLLELRPAAVALGRLVRIAADTARQGGASWQRVGDALRITKQAAQQRFGAKASVPPQGESLFDVLGEYGH